LAYATIGKTNLGRSILLKRRLANTSLDVSVLGLGTVKFGRNQAVKYPDAFQLPSDKELTQLIRKAKDYGINLLDTAPAYGESEQRLGKLLQGERQQWIISTKVGEIFNQGVSCFNFTTQHIVQSIEDSLSRLKTDYLDIVLVHSDGHDQEIIERYNVFATLEKLKQQGKLRAFGMSCKTLAGGMLTVRQADLAMITFNAEYQAERAVIGYAAQLQKGIFVKKAFASGHLIQAQSQKHAIANALQCVFAEKGVTSVIIGTINLQHLQVNVECVNEIVTMVNSH
jgi:aryl-alcohol dehydrogenase-like predicted oxidoreductase